VSRFGASSHWFESSRDIATYAGTVHGFHCLKKIRAHRVKAAEVEEALSREPTLIYEQDAYGEAGTSTAEKRNAAVFLQSF